MSSTYDFSVATPDGGTQSLNEYKGRALLIVNVASKCGLTPQYEGLEALYRDTKDSGLEVLGFPCNQFGGQEPGTAAEIQDFCTTNYDVTFPIFSKIDVNGPNADPLYTYLRGEAPGESEDGEHHLELHQVPHRPRRRGDRPLRAKDHSRGDPWRPGRRPGLIGLGWWEARLTLPGEALGVRRQ